jgi:HlyD family secretion protein
MAQKRRPKPLVGIASAAFLLAIFVIGRRWLAGTPEPIPHDIPSAAESPIGVTLATVGFTSAPRMLEATGTVKAEMEAAVSTKVTGRIVRMLVREGDAVRGGQPVAVLDARDLDAAVAQADASLRAANVGRDTAVVAERMERSMSAARIVEARARVAQSAAAVQAAQAKLDLLESGPRKQERAQASLAVAQAKSSLALADSNLRRMESLMNEGAISRQQYDIYRTASDVAKAQYDTAVQSQSMTEEGSRAEEIRAAREQLRQAQAGLAQAEAGVSQAEAAAHQVEVRRQEIRGADAQIGQTRAALRAAEVTRDFATVAAPFDGVVTAKLADPGAMATPGTPLVKIQGGAIRLEAVVPESGLSAAGTGRPVTIRLDAMGARPLVGRISEVAPQGDASSHTFLVKVTLPSGSGARAGMFGRAAFPLGNERRMRIPAPAVVERDGLHYVYVAGGDGEARLRLVTVGESDGGSIAVLSGLQPGERIVTSGLDRVTDGARIAPSGGESRTRVAGR